MDTDVKDKPIFRLRSRFDKIMLGLTVAGILSACGAGVFWITTGMTPDSAEWFWVSLGVAGVAFPSDTLSDDEHSTYAPTDYQPFYNSARTATVLSAVLILLGLMIPLYRW